MQMDLLPGAEKSREKNMLGLDFPFKLWGEQSCSCPQALIPPGTLVRSVEAPFLKPFAMLVCFLAHFFNILSELLVLHLWLPSLYFLDG